MKAMNTLPKLVSAVFFCFLVALHTNTQAGLFGDSVKFADLTQLSPDGLEALKEPELEVFLARVELARAEEEKKKAEKDLTNAKRTLQIKELELKAVRAEEKAAEENGETDRMGTAAAAVKKARQDMQVANLLVSWKTEVVKARKTGVKKAKFGVELAEAKRDLAWITQLVAEKAPSAQKYSMTDYQKKVEEKQRSFDKAAIKEKLEIVEAENAKEEYERMATDKPGKE
ncbi:MAG: hypothetical protein SWH78_10650 [Thermodesulfobacteriota bacterium]|nr:hypothetical protein [Thermodesulfobacteriota bacterium]